MPLPEDLDLAYRTYYTHAGSGARERLPGMAGVTYRALRMADSLLKRCSGLHASRRRLDRMYLGSGDGRRLLEVGCGRGGRLLRWQQGGWDVTGVDVDRAAVEAARARGVCVRGGDPGAAGLEEGSFDAVVSNHVLEHVPDPVGWMRSCVRMLKPGGRFVLATPNPRSLGHAVFGRHWMGLDAPRHLHLFAPACLRELATQAGLPEATVFTTAARALSFARGSLEIAVHGRHVMHEGRRLKPGLEARALAFQYRAWGHHVSGRGDGEECVLVAGGPL